MMATFKAFEAHAAQEAPRECCGIILRDGHGEESYWPCRNINPAPDEFTIHPEDWDAAEDAGQLLAVCHSHPGGSGLPSSSDRAGIDQHGLPWYILGDQLQRVDATVHPLAGRVFIYGWSDCYTLARDWYLAYFGVRLPDYPREDATRGQGISAFLERFEAFGFREVDEAMPGDLLLMAVGSKGVPNHVAVLLDGGDIFDHQVGRLSGKRPLRPVAAAVTHRLRYAL